MNRTAEVGRKTSEVEIALRLDLDGRGAASIDTGIGFFDHMLEQTARHSGFDLDVTATGDRHVDDHHTVEDVGIAFGEALDRALGEARGIQRYGWVLLPMDEALAQVVIDLSGRGLAVLSTPFDGQIGAFDAQLINEFLIAFARTGRLTLHASLLAGSNRHHRAEAIFKGLGQALGQAVARSDRSESIPSTKGTLR